MEALPGGFISFILSLAFVGESHPHICLLQTYLTVCKDVVMVGLGDCRFQIQLLQWSLGITHTGTRHSLKGGFRAIDSQNQALSPAPTVLVRTRLSL